MKRAIWLGSLLVAWLAAQPAVAEAPQPSADRCVGRVRLRGAIYDYQNGELQPGVAEVLDQVAKTFREQCPEKILIIEAHAFEMPTAELNLRLSDLRAHTVRHELVKRGVPERQMLPAGMGATQPLVPASEPDSLGENRRVTFRVAD